MKKNLTIEGCSPHAVKKALLIMKLTSLLILVTTLQVSAHVSGQGKVSLKLNQVEISKALHSIERQGTYRFLYNSRLDGVSRKISIDVDNSELRDVLGKLFAGTDLTYKVLENNLIVVISSTLAVQDIRVTGKVTGDNGQALSGVSVSVKGTSRGTTTDNNGNFELTVPENGTLTVSYIGFQSKEVPVNSQSVIDVKLTPSTTVMDQVVVVGYGTQRKLDVTGSVAQIKGSELAKLPSVNPVSGLQGKVAGVQITNSGVPGANPDIKIRGIGTYQSNSQPLYVVDGVWVTDLNFLNSSDIETMSILKDASSEAIYGVRGANGVVLITTKRGSNKGRSVVTYNGTVGFQSANHIPKMANGFEYATMYNELTRNSGGTDFLDSSKFGNGTDWFKEEMRKGIITNHQISVNGGGDKSTYNLSLGYFSQQGLLKTNKYDRYTVSFNNNIDVSKHVRVGYTAIGSYSKSHDVPGGIWRYLYTTPNIVPVKNPDGTYGDPQSFGLGSQIGNPQVLLDYNNATTQKYHINGNGYIDIKFLQHFTLHSSIGGIFNQEQFKNFTPIYQATTNQSSQHNTLTTTDFSTRNWIIENTLTYANTFGDHKITALIGQTAYRNFTGEDHATAQDGTLSSDPTTWYYSASNPGSIYSVTPANAPPQTYPSLERVSSYFGRLTYSFMDRYTITGTLRSDASTKFTTSFGRATLPSVGAAWIVTNESFMKNQHIFDALKIKGSWGQVGNSSIPAYIGTQTTFSGNGTVFGDGPYLPGQSIASAVPPILNWEKGEGTDIGLEASILHNRLNIEADYYNKKTLNFIFPILYAGQAGLQSQSLAQNAGKLRNQGVELSLSWKDNIGKDWTYSISGNISYNKNKFLQSSGGSQKIYSGGAGSTGGQLATVTTVGQPIGEFYGYKVAGIFQTAAEVTAYTDKDGNMYQPDAQPGDFKYVSTTGKGPLSGNDRVPIGNPNPKYVYGFSTTWTYKAFDLGIDFNGVAGVDVYNANKGLRFGSENWTKDFYDHRWHGAGTSNSNPSVALGGRQNYYINSWYVESGAYLRIRNIQLGYTLPKESLSMLGIQSLRIYLNAQNPAIFTKYKGFTPEIGNSLENGGGAPGTLGIDNNVYPLSAVYNLGVNLSF
jgi:TonB-linked SusC/RagA family outer membrane protein